MYCVCFSLEQKKKLTFIWFTVSKMDKTAAQIPPQPPPILYNNIRT